MHIEVVSVNPETAKQWLENNRENRPILASTVDAYARIMKAGNWQLTHQGVAFSISGRLVDGQHRLHAILRSGVTVQISVTYDVPESSFDVLDRGRTRSIADIIRRPRRETEVITQIFKVVTGNFVIDAVQIASIDQRVWDACQTLHEYAPTAARFLTVVGVRAGAVLRMVADENAALWVMDQYRALSHADFSQLSKSVNALARQLVQRTATSGYEVTLRSFRAFDYASADKERIVIKDNANLIDEIAFVTSRYGIKSERVASDLARGDARRNRRSGLSTPYAKRRTADKNSEHDLLSDR